MGKAAKEHRKRVQARNLKLQHEKRRREKFQQEFIMNLIKQEQEKGLFNNNPGVDGPMLDGPMLDGPMMDGPMLDVPVLETPTIESPTEEVNEIVIESPVVEEVKSEESEN